MEKEWFIYKGDHHTGPYGYDDVEKMFLDGIVEDNDLIWKEGLSDWVPLRVLLQKQGIKREKRKKRAIKFPIIVDSPPSIYFDEYPTVVQVEVENETATEIETPKIVSQKNVASPSSTEKSRGNIFNAIIAALVLLSIMYRVLVFFNEASTEFKIPQLSESDLSRLESVAAKDYKEGQKPQLEVSLDKDLKQIVVASNFKGEGFLQIYLKAKKGKILGTGPSELLGDLKVNKSWGKTNDLTFLKGTRIFPGYYDVYISGYFWNDIGPMTLYLSQYSWINDIFKPLKKVEVQFETQFLFSKDGHSDFNKKLQDYNEKLEQIKSYKYEGKLESYRTIKALLAQIIFHYKESVKVMKRGYDIYRFENRYAKTIGPVLRSLVLENRKLFLENRDKNPNEANFYRQFFEFGKRIGAVVSKSITDVEKIKLIDEKKRKIIQEKYVNSFEAITEDLDKFSEKIKILDQMDAFGGSIFMRSY